MILPISTTNSSKEKNGYKKRYRKGLAITFVVITNDILMVVTTAWDILVFCAVIQTVSQIVSDSTLSHCHGIDN